ncbi:uncharacterized protein N7477_003493 [Penicillium maclennaniae]|uniref:uncharacterized protein n=1 Tax=Penicillium maclennaniae TaxID=1343394 RepID=UPI00253FB379|nr:uncharacterized protein N7477_003493 [Penicillium maclennaniae]KAJ5677860.1 hypothetical protein N7477_003493 [Penicillium maclennaniae]
METKVSMHQWTAALLRAKEEASFESPTSLHPALRTIPLNLWHPVPQSPRARRLSHPQLMGLRRTLPHLSKEAAHRVIETPPRQRGVDSMPVSRSVPMDNHMQAPITTQSRAHSPAAVMGTPIQESPLKRGPAQGSAPIVPVTPEKSQSKSIYEKLGWDDDEMEF